MCFCVFFFSSRRRHTRCREVSWARRCVQETGTSTGSTSCTTCKKGQFFDGLSECIDCPAGHYCPDPTSAIVKPCPAGFYAKEAQSSCSICPEGNYCGKKKKKKKKNTPKLLKKSKNAKKHHSKTL
eukprot:TRINITY_DN23383_c0_g1_i1.p2 TRINITY_DN23383_c0_g1~~TRINITY_DN23383_c0_g1_i1.p2  ORF type:complete len:126 (+),score=43.45 TRINITY_DN23383_c0_g1_i1:85-462(+)